MDLSIKSGDWVFEPITNGNEPVFVPNEFGRLFITLLCNSEQNDCNCPVTGRPMNFEDYAPKVVVIPWMIAHLIKLDARTWPARSRYPHTSEETR